MHACSAWMKQSRRPLALSTDVIVGFPGETEADFRETLGLLDEVEYDSIFSFTYSPRPGTPAMSLGDKVPEEVKSERLQMLQEKQRAIQMRRNAALLGSEQEVHIRAGGAPTDMDRPHQPEPGRELHGPGRGSGGLRAGGYCR
jgi:tRNA-2-methylthio-N6-dimethylallyladenosine synthase